MAFRDSSNDNPAMSKSTKDIRKQILDTARVHLRRFGGQKMTVVEIARSLGMSHANVYRFFRGKTGILDALVDEWLAKVESFFAPLMARPSSAAERIESIVLELHRARREKLKKDAKFYEAFVRLIATRPEAVAEREKRVFEVFRKLISEGVAAGEFPKLDCNKAATALEDATGIFLHPLMIPAILNEMTEDRARQVVRYLLAGFAGAGAKGSNRKTTK
jgi:AcrR family transcriptional regulator